MGNVQWRIFIRLSSKSPSSFNPFRIDELFQHGFIPFLCLKTGEMLLPRIRQNVTFYETLEDFVADVSGKFSPNVKLDNIQNLFFYLGGFLAIVSIVFLLRFFLIKRQANRWTVRYLAKLVRITFYFKTLLTCLARKLKISKLKEKLNFALCYNWVMRR